MASDSFPDGRLLPAAVRIFTPEGEVAGAGCVLGTDLVATCAHVVALAAGCAADDRHVPESPVIVEFPWHEMPIRRTARVRHWSPIRADGRGDIAVLEFAEAVPDRVVVPTFWHDDEPWGHEFRMIGFPAEMPGGVWVSGEFRDRQEQGWLQLQAAASGQPITGGFSGAPVWDIEADAVTGIAVVADRRRYTKTAFVIPIGEVLGMDPDLVANPYRGWEPFDEEHADLFFGRDDDVKRVLSTLRRRKLVLVAGRSGIGKSSLVRAGVIPQFRSRGVRIATVRLSGDLSGVRAVTDRLDVSEDEPFAAWLTEQSAREQGATEPVPRLLDEPPAEGVLLFVDQFEELAAAAPQRARDLLRSLIELIRIDTDGRVRVVLTVRWDALDDLANEEFAEFLDGAAIAVAPMGRAQLREAIRRPAARAPGAGLDAELVERLIDDTVGEPGGLPLLQSLLSDMWAERESGVVTVADYERAEGVAGAVTRRAEHVLAQFTTPELQDATRRLLTLLAAPSVSDEGFVRSTVSMRDYPEQRSVAGRLARDRLVVVGRDAQGADTVELAHQALIDHWPKLLGWLRDDRDFRLWQLRLGQERARWEKAGRDSKKEALLRPGALETATEWVDKRGPDVPAADRAFIVASRKARRREVRGWQLVTALIAVLAVAAASTAVVAYRTSQERAVQLRLQAARTLAQESMRIADSDSGRALQFAQAAARHAPDDPSVRNALLYQQLRTTSIEETRSGPWTDGSHVTASSDGSIVAIAEGDHNIAVWRDLVEEPASWRLPPTTGKISSINMSRNGARLAVVTEDSAVNVWNIRDRSGPSSVRAPEPEPLPPTALAVNFDESGKWLAFRLDRTHAQYPGGAGNTDLVELYDTSGAVPTRVAVLPLENGVTQYPSYIDPTGAVIVFEEVGSEVTRNVARDARTGRLIHELPAGKITSTGAIVGCAEDKLVIWDAVTGAERFRPGKSRGGIGGCAWQAQDRTGRYAIWAEADDDDNFKTAALVDVETGRRYALPLRHSNVASAAASLIVPTDRGPQLLLITPNGLTRFAPAVPTDGWDGFTELSEVEWGPDGRFVVSFETGADFLDLTARVIELEPRRRVVAQAPVEAAGNRIRHITHDGKHLVLATDNGGITIYSLPDLTVEQRLTLPFPSLLGDRQPSATSIMQPGDDELAFHFAGLLTRWRISDGKQLGEQVPTWRDEAELQWMVYAGAYADLVPTRPDRFVIAGTGADVVRSLHDGSVLHTISVDRAAYGHAFAQPDAPIVYIRDDESGTSTMQNLDTGTISESPQQIPPGEPIGMTSDGLLVVDVIGRFEVWDFERGAKLFDITVPGSPVWQGAKLTENTLHLLSVEGDVYTLNLDRSDVLRRLCAINDRDFTNSERDTLPVGADTTPPCRGI